MMKGYKTSAYLLLFLLLLLGKVNAQFCGTPGFNGPGNIPASKDTYKGINTYFPVNGNVVLVAGAGSIVLSAVPPPKYETEPNYGITPISPGDLLLIIQMQDAVINYNNDANYGSGNPTSGLDGQGGTGYTDIGSSGKYEYVTALSTVPLTGGTLTFKGAGIGGGTVNTYVSAPASAVRGARTFQVIRIPQYSSLTLSTKIAAPFFNGKVGGVVALNVAGKLHFSTGIEISAGGRGFRGGRNEEASADVDISTIYLTPSSDTRSTSKGEGIAGNTRYTSKLEDNLADGYPGGDKGRGAPANAGGGGTTYRAGGGGGGNGGAGGAGGTTDFPVRTAPHGGRPGSVLYRPGTADIDRLFMGGGGGAGGEAYLGQTAGGQGGGIVLINAGTITGIGRINLAGQNSTGGGSGAGGTLFLNVKQPDPSLRLTVLAHSGNAGHLGGSGGGGQVFHNLPDNTITINVESGIIDRQGTPVFPSSRGQKGNVVPYADADLPAYLRTGCLPEPEVTITEMAGGIGKFPGNEAEYKMKIVNPTGGAVDVRTDVQLPTGFAFNSATATYSDNATGPLVLTNFGTDSNRPLLGDFYIPQKSTVVIILKASIGCNIPVGLYHASAQVIYADPTRINATRKIKPLLNAFLDSGTAIPTTYESVYTGSVAGNNYDGKKSAAEDVKVVMPEIKNNKINEPVITGPLCNSYNPPLITGQDVEVGEGTFSYEWESSADGIKYNPVEGSNSRDYDPPVLTNITWFRRQVKQTGCSPSSSASNAVKFTVNPAIIVDFTLPAICVQDGTAVFNNKTLNSEGTTSGLSYEWNFDDAAGSTSTNPNISSARDGSHVYTRAGIYQVTLTVTKDGICVQEPKVIPFTVSSVPVPDYKLSDTTPCSGQEVIFTDNSTIEFGELTKIIWHYNDLDPSATHTDTSPAKRSEPARTYPYTYPEFHSPASKIVNGRMEVYSGNSCITEKLFTITLKATPELAFDVLPPVCADVTVPFELNAGHEIGGAVEGEGKYSGKGITADGKSFDPVAAGPGVHPLVYAFTPKDGSCDASITGSIEVLSRPVFSAGRDLSVLKGSSIQLEATGSSGLSYKWTPPTFLNRDNVLNPVAIPTTDITYRLTVTTDTGGCIAFEDVNIKLLLNPEIPNTFSPNGDGVNDIWNIKYLDGYDRMTVTVYNRYGEKVFSSRGYQKGWDGKSNGKDLPQGTYYYVIDPHNGIKSIIGPLTILR